MRPKDRIERILNLVRETWEQDPDMRFLQLMSVFQCLYSRENNDIGKIEVKEEDGFAKVAFDLFSVEDDAFESFLKSHLEKIKNRS